jgi:hypothetical protein
MDRTQATVKLYPLFEVPTELTDETIGYLLSQKEFASNTRTTLK